MSHHIRFAIATVLAGILTAPVALADNEKATIAFMGNYFVSIEGDRRNDTGRGAEPGLGLSMHLGLPLNNVLAVDFNALWVTLEREEDQNHDFLYSGGLDLLYSPFNTGAVDFYGIAGFGAVYDDTRGQQNTAPFWNVGLGTKIPIHSSGLALRLDARYVYSFYDGTVSQRSDLRDFRVSAGIDLPLFGGTGHHPSAAAPTVQHQPAPQEPAIAVGDSDNDGVLDIHDRCPGTAAGERINTHGCPVEADSDSDGVPDSLDRCAGTPTTVQADANGCRAFSGQTHYVTPGQPTAPIAAPVYQQPAPSANDSDGDGVPNNLDRCSGTPATIAVDANGCRLFTGQTRSSQPMPAAPRSAPIYQAPANATPRPAARPAAPVAVRSGPDSCPNTHPDADEDARGCALANQTIMIPGINFKGNSIALDSVGKSQVNQIAAMMKGQGSMRVEISAYGSGANADRIAVDRAIAVKDQLKSQGIASRRVAVISHAVGARVQVNILRP